MEQCPRPYNENLDIQKWQLDIQNEIEIPRSVVLKQEETTAIDLHVFEDVSKAGHCAVAYVLVQQLSNNNQYLLTRKSGYLKKIEQYRHQN